MKTYEKITTPMCSEMILLHETGMIYSIPMDEANSDYQRYLRWLENPNEVEHLTETVPPATE